MRLFLKEIRLFADDLDQNPLFTPTVKLTIKNLLPRAKVQFAFSHGNNNLPAHYLSLQMGVGIVLVAIMVVLIDRVMWGEFFQPNLVIMVQAGFIIVYEHGSGDMHGVY